MLASHVANWGWTTLTRRLDNVRVFSGCVRATRLRLLNASLQVIRKEAGLEDVRLHDSRYSSASRVLALGKSLPRTGKVLRQAQVQTTTHYAYFARNALKVAAVRISANLEASFDTLPNHSAGLRLLHRLGPAQGQRSGWLPTIPARATVSSNCRHYCKQQILNQTAQSEHINGRVERMIVTPNSQKIRLQCPQHRTKTARILSGAIISLLLFAVGINQQTWANSVPSGEAETETEDSSQNSLAKCTYSFIVENDLLFTDRNYTSGVLLTHTCDSDTGDLPGSLRKLNSDLMMNARALSGVTNYKNSAYSRFGGLWLYTPNRLDILKPKKSDGRPYASLLIYGDSILHANKAVAIKQEMQIGVLGLPLGGIVQSALHKVISADDPQGWSKEISRGGEPVFAYGLQKQHLVCANPRHPGLCGDRDFDLTANWSISVGYYTSLRTGFTGRLGLGEKLRSPFWGDFGTIHSKLVFSPLIHFPSYSKGTGDKANGNNEELYLFATAGIDVVLYSAVLQGQFRRSHYEIRSSDVTRVVPYASLGIVKRFGDCRVSLSHSFRGREIEGGKSHRWNSLSVGWKF
ncbi:MAG: DUF2219 family protein [Rhodospirillales bacterium]|nr:DUF2219 family protein [Rhodospirillales bacterium]